MVPSLVLAPDLASYLKVLELEAGLGNSDPSEFLSAADCASRTGLTVRALRVYEELGLITPRRSVGGWRQYGPRDLKKLNTIAVLKSAGLSLAQIGEVTCGSAGEPALHQVLAMQLDTWKRRQAEAERGHAIAEAALNRLRADQSLSIEELCNLIRNLEMTQLPSSKTSGHDDVAWLSVDPSVLDGYTGFYRRGEFGVIKIWRDGRRLFVDAPGGDTVALHPTSETEFYPTHGAGFFQYTFSRDPHGAGCGIRIRTQGVEFAFPRIDAATAERVTADLSERVQGQKPIPGSKAALRRLVEGIQANSPPYEDMTSQMEQLLSKQLPLLRPLLEYLGAFGSIEFRGVESAGCDQYDVHCERGTSRWRILLSADGKIAFVSYDWDRPKSAPSSRLVLSAVS